MTTNAEPSTELFFNVEEKTDKQHILDNPDTYIGSVETMDADKWVLNGNSDGMVRKNIQYVPGLFKLFDEGIVNCRDHFVRMQTMVNAQVPNSMPVTHIDITVEPDGTICMVNDGNGCDVVQKEDGVWMPEVMFARLRTSTNFNKDEKRIVGGKNGYGFKLVLIWSTYGRVETVDHVRGLKYVQEYRNNLEWIGEPVITKCKTKPYTKITFKPDYARLGVDGLTPDMAALFKRRAYDIGAAIPEKNVRVKYNNETVPVRTFEQYISLYIGSDKTEVPRVYESNGERWEYAVALTPTSEFMQVSFVNGIHTAKGGKHVEYILNQIASKIAKVIEKKRNLKVNNNTIKEQLILFLRCDIENPSFDSQSKEWMDTPVSKFGSSCVVSDKFIEKAISKLGIMHTAVHLMEAKHHAAAAKQTDGSKTRTVRGILKLVDANWAGTAKSNQCILILCEGDSAKAGILSGLSSEDRNTVGVYPVRGKLMNVRGESIQKIASNQEVTDIKMILGLVKGKKYLTMEDVHADLRYSKVVFMTDQDLDGSHIKGLAINLFACEWPSLLNIPGFLAFMNTPILKARKGKEELCFYNMGEFEEWRQSVPNLSKWDIKYYKGLGTSTAKEFKQYFAQKKMVDFVSHGDTSLDAVDMVFNKARANDRKEWLKEYNRQAFVDTRRSAISFEEFIHQELIHFSKYDCDRSIPNLMDGLKVSQRKILYAAFKRNLVSELKVNNLTGYVSENACYHHGEQSLNGTIIGMAQTFVGSNNINLLTPNGQFGTRIQGGSDHASDRYIFTQLEKITKVLFPPEDNQVIKYLEDDGVPVEPLYYQPILPMVLVNGAEGIGTGFSTSIPCFHPLQIADYLQSKLREDTTHETIDFVPYYEGFQGNITKLEEGKFLTRGTYVVLGEDTIQVNELPVGFWTEDFKELLESLCVVKEDKDKKKEEKEKEKEKATKKTKANKAKTTEPVDAEVNVVEEKKAKVVPVVRNYQELWTDTQMKAIVTFSPGKLRELESAKGNYGCNGLEKLLKLYNVLNTTNMHLFDAQDKLQKYDKVPDIIDAYFSVRLDLYNTRREYLLKKMEHQCKTIVNKVNYIQAQLDDVLDLRKKKKHEVSAMLLAQGFEPLDGDDNFDYLVKMPMDSVTEEKVESLVAEKEEKERERDVLTNTTPRQMWLNELEHFREKYQEYIVARNAEKDDGATAVEEKHKSKVVKKPRAKAVKASSKA